MITPAEHLSAVTRSVDTIERDGVEMKRLTATRTYPTDVADLWDAVTNPDRIPRWFLPVSGDLRLGGRFQFDGNAGGEVLACEPQQHLAITWGMGDQISWVDLHLSGAEGAATLELVHVAPMDGPEARAFWEQFGPGAVGVGWEQGLMGLAIHVVGADALDPAAGAAWQLSAEGIEFATASSNAWAEASIAGGEDPDAARAAAERTTAFYTTVPEEEPVGDPATRS